MKLAVVRLFRIGHSRSWLLGPPDKLPAVAVDGPVAKSSTRDRVNWFRLAAHEDSCFLGETAEKLSGSVTPFSGIGTNDLAARREGRSTSADRQRHKDD
jgi:hypothetical protein